jgi:hypothetical protein
MFMMVGVFLMTFANVNLGEHKHVSPSLARITNKFYVGTGLDGLTGLTCSSLGHVLCLALAGGRGL